MMNIALIASSQELAEKILLTKPDDLGFKIEVFTSINEFFEKSVEKTWSGFVADARTMIAPSLKKSELLTLSSVFPFMRIRNESNGSLSGNIASQNFRSDQMWQEFVEKNCRLFSARKMRKHIRMDAMLAIEVKGSQQSEPLRTYCLDFSMGGAYLLGSMGPATDPVVQVRLRDDPEGTWMEAKVLWNSPWDSQAPRAKPEGFAISMSQWCAYMSSKLPTN